MERASKQQVVLAFVAVWGVLSGLAGGQTIDTTRDQVGRMTSSGNGPLRQFFEYDRLGRVMRTEYRLDGQSFVFSTAYGYPQNPGATSGPGTVVQSQTFPDRGTPTLPGERLDYTYDSGGAQRTIRTTPVGAATQDVVRDVLRNARGQTTRVEYGDGSVTTHAYNEATDLRLNRIVTVHSTVNPQILQDYQYSFDTVGNVTGIMDSVIPSFSASYTYDSLDQLRSMTNPVTGEVRSYDYDAVGNLTNMEGVAQTYGNGRGPHALATTANGSVSYGYDFNGNVVSISNGTTIIWNAENMATQVIQGGVTRNQKSFVGESLWKKVEGAVTTLYLPALRVENGQQRKFFGAFAERAAEDGGLKFYHGDHLGSATLVTEAGPGGANVIRRAAFFPYGADKGTAGGTFVPKYQFNFKEKETTGFYDYGARLYNPSTGRWLSADDDDTDGANRYRYVSNNPLRYVDPTGHAQEGKKEVDPWEIRSDVGWFRRWFWTDDSIYTRQDAEAQRVRVNRYLEQLDDVNRQGYREVQQLVAETAGTPGGAAPPRLDRSSSGRSLVRKVGSRRPRNFGFAGGVYKLRGALGLKYPAGVNFTPTGFPDFSPYAVKRVPIRMTGTGSDFGRANLAAGFGPRTSSNVDIDGVTYTWHHHHDKVTMLLVPQDLHNAVQHTGGNARVLDTGTPPVWPPWDH